MNDEQVATSPEVQSMKHDIQKKLAILQEKITEYSKDPTYRILFRIFRTEMFIIVAELLFIAKQSAEISSMYAKDIYPVVIMIAIIAAIASASNVVDETMESVDRRDQNTLNA